MAGALVSAEPGHRGPPPSTTCRGAQRGGRAAARVTPLCPLRQPSVSCCTNSGPCVALQARVLPGDLGARSSKLLRTAPSQP